MSKIIRGVGLGIVKLQGGSKNQSYVDISPMGDLVIYGDLI